MPKFDVLHRALDVFGPHFLEASAGTGKTFAIEHLVVRLLMRLSIDQILVVTFTRAATRELKMRVRANLDKALNLLKSRETGIDYLDAILEQGEEATRAAIARLEEALFYFERAQIFTIHGFCHRMLEEFAFEAKVGTLSSDPDSKEYRAVLRQIVNDFLRTCVHSSAYSPRQLEILFKKYSLDQLSSKISYFLEQNQELPQIPNFAETCQLLEKKLTHVQVVQTLFLEDFQKLSGCYKKMGGESVLRQAELLGEILEKRHCSPAGLDELIREKEFFLSQMTEQNLKVKAKIPSTLHYPGIFQQLLQDLYPLLEKARDPATTLMRLAKDCQCAAKTLPQMQEVVFPDALLQKMQESVANPHFAACVRKRYQAAIIDEFQDTDPVQWKIFHELFVQKSSEMAALYLVGDPKQSIYAFRSADVYTYLEARRALGDHNRFFLDTNFRSSADLVQALNTLFSLKEWLPLPLLNQTLEYSHVKAHKGGDATLTPLHFFMAAEHSGRQKAWPLATTEEELFFPFIAREIQRLKKKLSSYAVLVKDRFQAERLQLFLRKQGIASNIRRGEGLNQSLAFSTMQTLLELMLDPRNLSLIKQVLAEPLFSWDEESLKEDAKVIEMRPLFASLSLTLRERGFGTFFQALLDHPAVLENVLGRHALSFYTDLRQIAEILMQQEASIDGLFWFLKSLKEVDPEEDPRLKRRQEQGEEQVVIMTIHMSKGLEFEVVFALGLASRHAAQEEWVRTREGNLIPFEQSHPACVQALHERDAEKMRQLYVALTRAKSSVYVPVLFDLDQKAIPEGSASPIELFCSQLGANSPETMIALVEKLRAHCRVDVTDLREADLSPLIETESEERILPEVLQMPPSAPKLQILSFSTLSTKLEGREKQEFPQTTEKNAHTLPQGAETGTILHQILEKVIASKACSIDAIVAQEIKRTHLESWQEVISQMVKNTLDFLNLPAENLLQETAFLFPFNGMLIKGFADLIFEKEGKYYLLDWKSNWLGPADAFYTTENMEKAMHEHDYFLQASIYATALKRYLALVEPRPFEECFGGALYVFLRGGAIHHFVPSLLV